MNIFDDTMLIYRVARNYYIDNLSQNEIAMMTNISRPQISRLIKRAHELGIARVDISLPSSIDIQQLKEQLRICLDLDDVIIPSNSSSDEDLNNNFYSFAANYIYDYIDDCSSVGLGWGRSLYETSLQLSYRKEKNQMSFYSLVGSSGNNNPYMQTNGITDRFAERFRGKAHYINTLAVTPKASISEVESKRLEAIQNHWKSLDAAIVGIGGYELSEQFAINELSHDEYILNHKEEIFGDLIANFFLKDKRLLKLPERYCISACPLDDLKKIPKVIAISKGLSKVDAIYFAAKNKYIKALITDQQTAKAILEKYT